MMIKMPFTISNQMFYLDSCIMWGFWFFAVTSVDRGFWKPLSQENTTCWINVIGADLPEEIWTKKTESKLISTDCILSYTVKGGKVKGYWCGRVHKLKRRERNNANHWEKYSKSLRKILKIFDRNTLNYWEKYWNLLSKILKIFERITVKRWKNIENY